MSTDGSFTQDTAAVINSSEEHMRRPVAQTPNTALKSTETPVGSVESELDNLSKSLSGFGGANPSTETFDEAAEG